MDLEDWEVMDPHMLVGLLNTELRNHAESLEDLLKTHNLPLEGIILRMRESGYAYQPELKQFR